MKRIVLFMLFGICIESNAQVRNTVIWGTVYNIFHEEYVSDEEFFRQVDKDVATMKNANLNHVMIFPMSQWDPATRQLRWTRTDYLVKKIAEAHLEYVPILLKQEQCSYYFPIWMYDEIPGFRQKYERRNGSNNNRENVDFADPHVYPLLESYIEAVVQRYGKNPALSFYNLWNEPHYSSDDDRTIEQFRNWLAKKYGSLDRLNRIWGDEYRSWSEVSPFLNDDWNSSMPQIDWTIFCNELNGELLGQLMATLRKYDTLHYVNANPVGTPWADFSKFGGYATDNWVFTPYNDINGASYYPDAWERSHDLSRCPAWLHNLALNTIRSASGSKEFILTEMFTNAQNGLTLNGYLDGKTISRIAWMALSNDCKGILFWKWDPFRRGRQSLGRGLTTLEGELAPRGEAVKDIGRVLNEHGELLLKARLDTPRVAILMDMVGLLKTLEQTTEPSTTKFMYESNAGLFKALFEGNIAVDELRMDLGLSLEKLRQYRVLFLPFQIVIRREIADILKEYVRQGGWLVADARTATLDQFDFAYKTSPGAGLAEVFGASRRDWIGRKGTFAVSMFSRLDSTEYTFDGRYFRDQLAVSRDVEIRGRFSDDGTPAVIAHRFGRGMAVLSAVPLGGSFYADPKNQVHRTILDIVHESGVRPEARFLSSDHSPMDVKVHSFGEVKVVYVINDDEDDREGILEVNTNGLKATQAQNIITDALVPFEQRGDDVRMAVSIPAGGVLVVALSSTVQ